jgi:hypothetical protein
VQKYLIKTSLEFGTDRESLNIRQIQAHYVAGLYDLTEWIQMFVRDVARTGFNFADFDTKLPTQERKYVFLLRFAYSQPSSP